MQIRPMTKGDLETVLEIEQSLFPNDAWSVEMFKDELAEVPLSRYVVIAELDNRIIGYASLRFVGSQGDINTIAIREVFQQKGFGKQLLQHLLTVAKEKGVREIFLEVRVDNQLAIELYRKAGFEKLDLRRNYYGTGIDGIVMRKKLT